MFMKQCKNAHCIFLGKPSSPSIPPYLLTDCLYRKRPYGGSVAPRCKFPLCFRIKSYELGKERGTYLSILI